MERYRVILTRPAKADLADLAKFISQDSPQAAENVSESIVSAISSLVFMPQRFKQVGVSTTTKLPVHWLIVSPYVIYYRVGTNSVHILTIRHGKRRPLKRFEG